MAYNLLQVAYTPGARAALIENPRNRIGAVRPATRATSRRALAVSRRKRGRRSPFERPLGRLRQRRT